MELVQSVKGILKLLKMAGNVFQMIVINCKCSWRMVTVKIASHIVASLLMEKCAHLRIVILDRYCYKMVNARHALSI